MCFERPRVGVRILLDLHSTSECSLYFPAVYRFARFLLRWYVIPDAGVCCTVVDVVFMMSASGHHLKSVFRASNDETNCSLIVLLKTSAIPHLAILVWRVRFEFNLSHWSSSAIASDCCVVSASALLGRNWEELAPSLRGIFVWHCWCCSEGPAVSKTQLLRPRRTMKSVLPALWL